MLAIASGSGTRMDGNRNAAMSACTRRSRASRSRKSSAWTCRESAFWQCNCRRRYPRNRSVRSFRRRLFGHGRVHSYQTQLHRSTGERRTLPRFSRREERKNLEERISRIFTCTEFAKVGRTLPGVS